MKEGIHPKYVECKVTCTCGNSFITRSTKPSLSVDICSACHPFFTGAQKILDTAGRVERFEKKYKATGGKTVLKEKKTARKSLDKDKAFKKFLSTAPVKKKLTAKEKTKGSAQAKPKTEEKKEK